MLFKVTHDLLMGKHFYREGMTIDSPGFAHPYFEPLDDEAARALKAIGIDKEIPKEDASKAEAVTPSEEVQPVKPSGKRGRPSSRRQPY